LHFEITEFKLIPEDSLLDLFRFNVFDFTSILER